MGRIKERLRSVMERAGRSAPAGLVGEPTASPPVDEWSDAIVDLDAIQGRRISIATFDAAAVSDIDPIVLVGQLVLERLPYAFLTSEPYLTWKAHLAPGLHVDPRDLVLVGSAGTGRSLNSRKKFKTFSKRSDLDIAVISASHFDQAWHWFRTADPQLLGLDQDAKKSFAQHSTQYIAIGMIAANEFLSYLPFGPKWLEELQRSERFLPPELQGRPLKVRIYRDSASLRHAQLESLKSFRSYRGKAQPAEDSADAGS